MNPMVSVVVNSLARPPSKTPQVDAGAGTNRLEKEHQLVLRCDESPFCCDEQAAVRDGRLDLWFRIHS